MKANKSKNTTSHEVGRIVKDFESADNGHSEIYGKLLTEEAEDVDEKRENTRCTMQRSRQPSSDQRSTSFLASLSAPASINSRIQST
jgi:hypothetical protein